MIGAGEIDLSFPAVTAFAALLIGGTSIFGGRATLVGTVFGCFII